ncbi:unnamed protein product, partial [Ectocarpus sp. 6 AP-2014]
AAGRNVPNGGGTGGGVGGGKASGRQRKGSRGGSLGDASSFHSSDHGMKDFRVIPRWSFFSQPLLDPAEKMKTSIGVLVARAGVVGEAAVEGPDEHHQDHAQSRLGRGVFLASQKIGRGLEGGSLGLGSFYSRRSSGPLRGLHRRRAAIPTGEINSPPESPIGLGLDDGSAGGNGGGYSASGGRQGSSTKLGFGRKGGSMGPSDHSHQSEQEARACDVCIERRRKRFGEVRLILWYQYDEFAEMCSHTWPEEPLKPPKIVFSPNQLYRKGMVFWEMFRPYVTFLKEVDAISSWGRPRRRCALVSRCFYTYMCQEGGGSEGGGGEETAELSMSMSMRSTSRSQRKSSTTFFSLSRSLIRGNRGAPIRRRVSDPDPFTANAVGSATAGVALRNSSSAPSRTAPWKAKAPRSAPPSTIPTPTTMARTSIFAACSGASQPPSTPRALSISNAAAIDSNNSSTGPGVGSGVSRDVVHAAGVAKGGVISAAGAGSKKIKKLLPVRGTRDPELRELYERLGGTKRVPAVVNQLGKVFFTKSGPSMQLGLDKMGMMLIMIRQRFHPLRARDLGLTMTALFAHMVLQLWLYVSGR